MRVLYKDMSHAENNKYYISLIIFNNKKGNSNVNINHKKHNKISAKSYVSSATLANDVIADIETALSDAEVMKDVVDAIYASTGDFDDDVFIDADAFFELIAIETPEDIALKFFNGKDLDSKGQANPNRDYFRFDKKKNVESTDDPGQIYIDEIFDDVSEYIQDNADEDYFPDAILDVLKTEDTVD